MVSGRAVGVDVVQDQFCSDVFAQTIGSATPVHQLQNTRAPTPVHQYIHCLRFVCNINTTMSRLLKAYLRGSPLSETTNENVAALEKPQTYEEAANSLVESPDPHVQFLAFATLYKLSLTDSPKRNPPLPLIKRHHSAIVRMVSSKDFHFALCHLDLMFTALTLCKLPRLPRMNVSLLLSGVPIEKAAIAVSVANAYHVLLLQTFLQFTSASIASVVKGDGPVALLTVTDACTCFLSRSNIIMWLERVPSDHRGKHISALRKICGGFVKILGFVVQKPEICSLKTSVLSVLHSFNLCSAALAARMGEALLVAESDFRLAPECFKADCAAVLDLLLLSPSLQRLLRGSAWTSDLTITEDCGIEKDIWESDRLFQADSIAHIERFLSSASPKSALGALARLCRRISQSKLIPRTLVDAVTRFLASCAETPDFSVLLEETIPQALEAFDSKTIGRIVRICHDYGVAFQNTKCLLLILDRLPSPQAVNACTDTIISMLMAEKHHMQAMGLLQKRLNALFLNTVLSVFDDISIPPKVLSALVLLHSEGMLAATVNDLHIDETTKMVLLWRVISSIDKENDTVEAFLGDLLLQNPQLRFVLHYRSSFYHDIREPELAPIKPLDFLLVAATRIHHHRANIPTTINELCLTFQCIQKWLAAKGSASEPEGRILVHIIEEAVNQGYFRLAHDIARDAENAFKKDDRNAMVTRSWAIFCLLRLAELEEVPRLLAALGQSMKRLATAGSVITTTDVAWFKLLQLDYVVTCRSNPTIIEDKIRSVSGYFQSRPEFSIGGSVAMSVSQMVANLLMSSYLLDVTARHHLSQGRFSECLTNATVSIKILASILRRIHSNKDDVTSARNTAVGRLLHAYLFAAVAARKCGLLAESMAFCKEATKLNASANVPVVNVMVHFRLADEALGEGNLADFRHHYDAGSLISESSDQLFPKLAQLKSAMLFNAATGEETKLLEEQLVGMLATSTIDQFEVVSRAQFIDDLHDFAFSLSQEKLAFGLDISSRDDLVDTIVRSTRQISRLCKEITAMSKSPAVVLSGIDVERPQFAESLIDQLFQCKQLLLQCKDPKKLATLGVDEASQTAKSLTQCILALSHVAILRDDDAANELLRDVWMLQDWPRYQPFVSHEIFHAAKHASDNQSLLPRMDIGKNPGMEFSDLQLPTDWAVFTIDVCTETNNLIFGRLAAGEKAPVFVKIPMGLSWSSVCGQFGEIVAESNATTKKEVISTITCKEHRRQWWKKRFSLDLQLQELLGSVGDSVIGGFSGFFSTNSPNDDYQQFKQHFLGIWASVSGFPDVKMADSVVGLFYRLEQPENLHQLVSYVVGELGVSPQEQNRALRELRPLCKAKSTRATLFKHTVLIPSHRCTDFPWESLPFLRQKSVSRVPSVAQLAQLLQRDTLHHPVKSVGYVLNPGNDLPRTEQRFRDIFGQKRHFSGFCGEKPPEDALVETLFQKSLFLYLGHGGGEQYMRNSKMMKIRAEVGVDFPPALLLGCLSGAFRHHGSLEPTSNVFNWIAGGSPLVVANLWDVTDKDIDNFSMGVFSESGIFGGSRDICEAVATSRDRCVLKYLNGGAPVVYGLPLYMDTDSKSQ